MDLTAINEGTSMMVNNLGEERLLLDQLLPHMRVLEFGLGISTMTIAPLVRQVVTIEHKPDWYNEYVKKVPSNVIVVHVPANREPSPSYDDGTFDDFRNYVMAPVPYAKQEKFDLVYIDGRSRVACAQWAAEHYLKPGGLIFIHDYRHPDPDNKGFRRPEYEPVENFLELTGHYFAMGMFKVKDVFAKTAGNIVELPPIGGAAMFQNTAISPAIVNIPPVNADKIIQQFEEKVEKSDTIETDKSTCWYSQPCVDGMNKFYDGHIHTHNITEHMKPFTQLLNLVEPDSHPDLLDLGCGTAMLVPFCKQFTYTGSDLPHIVAGCAMRNYPSEIYRACDIVDDDLSWIKRYDTVVLNGVIDIMQSPLSVLYKVLCSAKKYVLIHRQEIVDNEPTSVHEGPGYNGFAWHSKINRAAFEDLIEKTGFRVVAEVSCSFANWTNGGSSFMLQRISK